MQLKKAYEYSSIQLKVFSVALKILSVILIILSALLCVVVLPAGIVGTLFGILLFFISNYYLKIAKQKENGSFIEPTKPNFKREFTSKIEEINKSHKQNLDEINSHQEGLKNELKLKRQNRLTFKEFKELKQKGHIMENNQIQPKRAKNITVILLLIFFFPIGAYLMWARTDWNKVVKIIISVVIALCIISAFGNSKDSSNDKGAAADKAQTDSSLALPESKQQDKTIKTPTETTPSKKQKEESPVTQQEAAPVQKQQQAPATVVTPKVEYKKSGSYKVGNNLDAGEYYIVANGSCYYEISNDSTGSFDSIVSNGNISTFCYVTLNDGQYFEINDGKFIDALSAPIPTPKNGKLSDGMYKVGRDIPSGEYNIMCNGSSCYISVMSDSTGDLNSIVTNDNFSDNKYVTVSDGQYLEISGGYIEVN